MSHRPGFYERYSVWILAVLVFLLPMVVVGAIKAKGNNRNDVKGWLPLEYPDDQKPTELTLHAGRKNEPKAKNLFS